MQLEYIPTSLELKDKMFVFVPVVSNIAWICLPGFKAFDFKHFCRYNAKSLGVHFN